MSDYTGNDFTGKELMQTVFVPIVVSYLENKISLDELTSEYGYARRVYAEAPMSRAVDELSCKIFSEMKYVTSTPPKKRFPREIGEDEFRRRCIENLKQLAQVFKSYDQDDLSRRYTRKGATGKELMQEVFIPIVVRYLEKKITLDEFCTQYCSAYEHYANAAMLTEIDYLLGTFLFDIEDATCTEEEGKPVTPIGEDEFRKRCIDNLKQLEELFQKSSLSWESLCVKPASKRFLIKKECLMNAYTGNDFAGHDFTGKEVMQEVFIPIVVSYLENKISMRELTHKYCLVRHVYLETPMSRAVGDIFRELFLDMDDATSDPPRYPNEIGEDELRRRCIDNLEKLDQVFKSYDQDDLSRRYTRNGATGKELMQEVFIPMVVSYLEKKMTLDEFRSQYFSARERYANAAMLHEIYDIFVTLFFSIEDATSLAEGGKSATPIAEKELRKRCIESLKQLDALFK